MGQIANQMVLELFYKKKGKLLNKIFMVILVCYPLRHIFLGLDLWDTGYNYANFEYMGLDHMDSMWLFSTYLATAMGHFLTKLPFAGTLAGMNFYTGLFISALALMGYFFCTRKLKMPAWAAFVGEMAAISLCWCPTALLYNYLTYVLFLGSVILLYKGLLEEKKWSLFGAGICLGVNVLVRFSNLPQAGMIVAVWAYSVLVYMERKVNERKEKSSLSEKNDIAVESGKNQKQGCLALAIKNTLWCLGGYLTALVVLFVYIQIRYGMDSYILGIQRLFAMTDNATDYKATSMLMGLVGTYVENLYWFARFLVIVLAGILLFGLVKKVMFVLSQGESERSCKLLNTASRLLWCGVSIAMLGWLYYRKFCSFAFYSYDSMYRPGILFLMLTMFIGVICIFRRGSSREEKLISGMVILIVLLTSIGSNNGVYPSLNNLFVAAPYTLWQCYRFVKNAGDTEVFGFVISSFPAKGIVTAFLALFLFQSTLFGTKFVFAEATGVQDVSAVVENNKVLSGIRMSPERAKWMTELTAYVEENELQGKEVILYGQIPSLSYYLQMPSAFNPWSDLRSYSAETMREALEEVNAEMTQGTESPVMIVENAYVQYLEGGSEALKQMGMNAVKIESMSNDSKWELLVNFMQQNEYEKTFSNEKFAVYCRK